jgi:hypothetical protein
MNLALLDIDENDVNITTQKIIFLHSYDDQALLYRTCDGEIPLHTMISRLEKHPQGFNLFNERLLNSHLKVIQAMCTLSPDSVKVESNIFKIGYGTLPLQKLVINCESWARKLSPVSKFADCFRSLLRLYPPAANFTWPNGNPSNPRIIMEKCYWDPYFYRYLCMNYPCKSVDSWQNLRLCDTNYKERRTALFMAYGNIKYKYGYDLGSGQESILARLRIDHADLVKIVIMYL